MIDFLTNCGNKNLQYLLVPSRLEAALAQLDSDRDGEIDCNEWCVSEPETGGTFCWRGSPVGVPRREDAIETALRNKFTQRAKAREAQAKAAAKEIAKFTSEFLNARASPASEAARVCNRRLARAGCPAMLYYDRQGQLGHAPKRRRPSRSSEP